MLAGIAAYRRHPWQRTLPDPPALWQEGGSQMLDYGATAPEAAAGAITMLFVPSLINRAYILDLVAERSAMRWLAARGVRPLLLDWGWPGAIERRFNLTDYIAGRLERALVAASEAGGGKVVLAGYCMGGLLGVAAAARRPDLLRGLVLLATPWDFHAGLAPQARTGLAALRPMLEQVIATTDTLPVDVLQTMFAALDPGGIAAKFRAFGRLRQDSARARLFVALEDWLNDGVPLAAPVARETLRDWYGTNAPAAGEWRVAGQTVQPERLRLPCFVAIPGQDRIVPPDSAWPLARLIPGAVAIRPAAGHIGMAAGSSATRVLWPQLLDWLRNLKPPM